jgi:putative sigma-54 modulation protein
MQIVIKGKNLDVTEHMRAHIEKKVSKLDRFLPNLDEARVDLAVQKTKSAEDSMVVQLTLRVNGTILRAEERSADMITALDTVLERMSRQIERYKGKHWRSKARASTEVSAPTTTTEEAEPSSEIVRVKRFQTRPMDVDEAIEQMELLGHDFFIFFNAANNAFSVVYRRRDGGYGLLLPELA